MMLYLNLYLYGSDKFQLFRFDRKQMKCGGVFSVFESGIFILKHIIIMLYFILSNFSPVYKKSVTLNGYKFSFKIILVRTKFRNSIRTY